PEETPGAVAQDKGNSPVYGGYTGYDAQFYQNAIDSAVKAAADQVIKNDINSGYSNGQMTYDLDQRINAVLRKYPGASWQSNSEVQNLTEKYTSNYGSDAYIDSVRNGSQATKIATQNTETLTTSQQIMNSVLQDGIIKQDEVRNAWNQLNSSIGQNTPLTQQAASQTLDLTLAYGKIQDAQNQYTKYMSDGSLSAEEAANMNSRLSDINKLLGDSGITAQSGVSGLPPALQNLGSVALAAVNQINSAISQANAAINKASSIVSAAQSLYNSAVSTSAKSSGSTVINNNVTGNTFSKQTTASDLISDMLKASVAVGY
ncbi:MAG TPA: hypothetical protein VN429_00730, partial [Methanospirillum sp.]|uniref:hypothetical protein n=1 Tax=Methanospirillum sp. TaxID=45200 RepID=UPI002D0E3E81